MEWYHCLTIIGSMIGMMIWSSRERRNDYLHIMKLIQDIKDEMKDFHGRLERQDAEHKAAMREIDLRFRTLGKDS